MDQQRAGRGGTGYVVAARVASGELGTRLGLSDHDLAVVTLVLATGAHGWRAFECETLDPDGTYVGTVRLTTHPAAGAGKALPGVVIVHGHDEDPAPAAARRRARPKRTPAQRRVQAALDAAGTPSDPARRQSDPERLEGDPASRETPVPAPDLPAPSAG